MSHLQITRSSPRTRPAEGWRPGQERRPFETMEEICTASV